MSNSVVARARQVAALPVSRRLTIGVGVGAAMVCMAVGAQVRVGWPIPFTLQTLFVLLSAALLGRRWGTASQAGYVLLGSMGVPVFAASRLFGPTFGYLVGFIVAAWLIGQILSRVEEPSLLRGAAAMVAGSAVILMLGMAYLAWGLGLGLRQAFLDGVVRFLLGDSVKLVVALAVWWRFRRPARAAFGR